MHKGLRRVIDGWPREIQEVIKQELRPSRGSSSPLTDEAFRKYLGLNKLISGEILSNLLKRNFYQFYDMLSSYLPDRITIASTNEVRNHFPTEVPENYLDSEGRPVARRSRPRSMPLFQIEFRKTNVGVDYSVSLPEFKALLRHFFEGTIDQLQFVPDMESKFLPRY